jgi:hypothetical protein
LWVDATDIRFKITPHDDLRGEAGGDWDLERRYPLSQAVKHRGIVQRYVEKRLWEDTDLFTEAYSRRIQAEPIRGCATMKELLEQYYTRVDEMFDQLRRKGFRADHPLPKFLIGRDQVFIGNQGNHRLAMAQVLGIRIAGEVLCRHSRSAA